MMRRSNFGDSPFDFERMFERMNRQFEEMNRQFARFADSRPAHALESGDALPSMWSQGSVQVDVAEREDSVIVTADLPGFEKAEIDLSVANDALTIRAEHDVDDAYESEHYVRRERRHHSVSRTIPLPVDVREEAASASYTNGVLTVTLPVVETDDEDDESHHIDVE
ncbi:Hsp20/alpha crystallin family protein [Salinigranum halophilum]|jgi:HSP20 family protein|uniref:Hsp20/alpha crystallin family protein n=1 Tax=Salinigranum halophilum TaxID=2565931 RepID=UPI00115C962D|nr:Hsp20/alpha crystallin family protein [Salinigranum halophilum]